MNKLIMGLHDKLMNVIDADLDAFFAERPFLETGGDPVITPLPESIQTNIEVEETAKVLKKAVDAGLPPVEPPKQLDFHT